MMVGFVPPDSCPRDEALPYVYLMGRSFLSSNQPEKSFPVKNPSVLPESQSFSAKIINIINKVPVLTFFCRFPSIYATKKAQAR